MTPHKLRIIIGTLQIGGAERHLSFILPELAHKGWKIKVITTTAIAPLKNELISHGIKVHTAPRWFEWFPFNTVLLRPIRLLLNLLRLMVDFLIDRQSITHYFLPRTYGLGMIASLLTRLKAPQLMSRRSLNYYQKKYKGFHTLEKFFHKRCDVILGNSQAVVHQLCHEEDVPRDKARLLYNGISLEPYMSLHRQDCRQNLNVSEKELIIVIVANLIPYKGHKDLIEALGGIKDKLPKNWKLWCVGRDDGIQKDLESQAIAFEINDRIEWLGSRQDIPTLLKASDLGLLCSHEEGFSNAILEGMAAGLPMIVTDVGGNKEAVVQGQTGLIVPPHDPSALGNAILQLATHEELRRKMGEKGFQRVQSCFSLEKCVETYHDLYKSLLRS